VNSCLNSLTLSKNHVGSAVLRLVIGNALTRNAEIGRNWCFVSPCIAFVRTNREHFLAFSILSLIRMLVLFALGVLPTGTGVHVDSFTRTLFFASITQLTTTTQDQKLQKKANKKKANHKKPRKIHSEDPN